MLGVVHAALGFDHATPREREKIDLCTLWVDALFREGWVLENSENPREKTCEIGGRSFGTLASLTA